jgi:formylglycine-generating enzyme required for sulfatase activity
VQAAMVAESWKLVPEKDEPSEWLAELLQLTTRARQWASGQRGRDGVSEIELVTIPAGDLRRGRNDGPPDERPPRVTKVDSFSIGRFEVTLGQYRQFLQESGYDREGRDPPGLRDPARTRYAASGITWLDARAFTIWISARDGRAYRLPTEAEWEWAARGTSDHRSPWGPNGRPRVDGNWGRTGYADLRARVPPTLPGALFARDRSVFGVADMGGNVTEWCLDAYDATYFAWAPGANPYGPVVDEGDMVMRGWSWNHPGSPGGAAIDRSHHGTRSGYTGYGFRVVRELERPGDGRGAARSH